MLLSRALQVKLVLFVLFCCALPSVSRGQRANRFPVTPPEWSSYNAGFEMLQSGLPFEAVLTQWESTLVQFPNSTYAAQLKDYIETLRQQLAQHTELPVLPNGTPDAFPVHQRINYYIGLLPEVAGRQNTHPGICYTTTEPTCQALFKLGHPAVSALIQHLDDRRLTRSIDQAHRVLRVQDVALQCLERILDLDFRHTDYLSVDTPESRARIVAEIGLWWERNKDKTPLAGYLDRLDTLVKNRANLLLAEPPME